MKPKNRLKRIRLISFAHVWLYFTGYYNLCMLYISPKGGGLTYFLKLFFHWVTFILIIFLLYRRKFCDSHIILVYFLLRRNYYYKKWDFLINVLYAFGVTASEYFYGEIYVRYLCHKCTSIFYYEEIITVRIGVY